MYLVKKNSIKSVTIYLTICLVVCAGVLYHSICHSAELDVTVKDGEPWVTASGELKQINMVAVKGVWEEYAIKLDDGEIVILIGEKVGELEDMLGKKITVSGALKPRMRYAGTLRRTIEVREVNK